jgi:hypothetical protein
LWLFHANPGSAPEGALGPLRRAIGKVASLGEAVTKGIQEPDEEELRDLSKRLGAVKKELMTMGRDLMVTSPRTRPLRLTNSSARLGKLSKPTGK